MSTDPDAAAPVGARMSYVYAVGRSGGSLPACAGRPGLDEGPLRVVEAAGLAALVSSVPGAAFDAEGLRAQMEDLARLEALARTHHAVVEGAYAEATVLPMRLATVYLDDTRVVEMLGARGAEFDRLLAQLEGHVELGVKVYADPRQVAAAGAAAPAAGSGAPTSPGRAYLQQRRAQRRSHRDAYQAAGAVAAEVPERVDGIAAARTRHRPQQGELAQAAGENIANDAYLVPAGEVDAFRTALRGLGQDVPGVRVEITGPWAPYSFATPPEAGAGDGGTP